MANTSRIKGFTVVGNIHGGSAVGQAQLYYVASAADEILAGDVVKLGGSADVNGIPTADLCGATDVPIGIVVGIVNPKLDPAGKMSTGSIVLDLPTVSQIAASGAGYILVVTDPDVLLEVETTTAAVTDVGTNCSHVNNARTAATYTSPATLDGTTFATTSTLNFNLRGFVQRPDNETGAYAKVLVGFNRHQFKSVGTTGV